MAVQGVQDVAQGTPVPVDDVAVEVDTSIPVIVQGEAVLGGAIPGVRWRCGEVGTQDCASALLPCGSAADSSNSRLRQRADALRWRCGSRTQDCASALLPCGGASDSSHSRLRPRLAALRWRCGDVEQKTAPSARCGPAFLESHPTASWCWA